MSTQAQVEPVTTYSEVQCEITLIPICSTPLCSPVKSVGSHRPDDNKDQDYIPSNLFSVEVMEEEEEEEKKSQKTEENERYKEVFSQLSFSSNCDLWLLFILLQDNLE